jgi:acyl-CoA synthetase (AMP-forming)/AMP-acid ligase II
MSALPRTQVLNSSTFKAPPLEDKSLCLPDFYDWQARNSPSHPFFLYEDGPENIRTILWAEAARGIHRAAHLVASRVSPEDAAAALEGRPVIVAALAATGLYPALPSVVSMPTPLTTFVDTVTYVTTEVGILRAGFSVFPISPRNSPEAVAHLLKKTGSNYLLAGGEPMLQKLANAALELLRADGHPEIPSSHMPHFEDLYPDDDSDSEFENYPTVKFDREAASLILHSSGQHVVNLSWKKYN